MASLILTSAVSAPNPLFSQSGGTAWRHTIIHSCLRITVTSENISNRTSWVQSLTAGNTRKHQYLHFLIGGHQGCSECGTGAICGPWTDFCGPKCNLGKTQIWPDSSGSYIFIGNMGDILIFFCIKS